jgi:hypothetical protein
MRLSNIEQWQWIPCKSIGHFTIGTSIFDYIDHDNLVSVEKYRECLWKTEYRTYKSFSENESEFLIPQYDFSFIIYTYKNFITHFLVETYLYYGNNDIIGTPIDKVMNIINRTDYDKKDSMEIMDTIQQIYYFYDIGLSIWTLDGIVTTAFCDNGIIPNDNDID